jgi:hypothetical protein
MLPPFEHILREIEVAAKNGLPFLAVTMAVTLPDICQTLKSRDGRTDSKLYKDWCKENLGSEFSVLTPDDLYRMRCGVVHHGRYGGLQKSVARVLFLLPGGSTFVNCRANDAYLYSLIEFCNNFCQAARTWFEKNKNDVNVEKHIKLMMQVYPHGLHPYVGGTPVLA